MARAGGALHLRCKEVGLPVEAVAIMRPWYPPALISVVRRTRSAAILHAHDSHAVTLAAVARAANQRQPLVIHRRISYPPNSFLADRWKYRHIDRWIAVSHDIAGQLDRAGAFDVAVVPSAVDIEGLKLGSQVLEAGNLRSELGIDGESRVIGLFGALARQKGHETLIDAAWEILEAVPEAIFLCVGEGGHRERLQRRVRRMGLGGVFRFTGFRRDAPELMSLCEMVVAPSLDGEGSSAVIKEAIVLGIPIVASDLPGNLEVLDGGGTVFAVGDVRALAEVVVSVLQGSDRRGDSVELGPNRLEIWSPKAMAAEVLSVYESLGREVELAAEVV